MILLYIFGRILQVHSDCTSKKCVKFEKNEYVLVAMLVGRKYHFDARGRCRVRAEVPRSLSEGSW